jgi:hypothetical protein
MKNFNLWQILLIILILKSSGYQVCGQDKQIKIIKPIYITGITYDSKSLEPLSNANFSVNNKKWFSTNESGRFSFFGNPHDTLIFKYLGYQPSLIIIPDTLKSQEYVMGVFMQQKSVKLAEVIIMRRVAFSSFIINSVPSDEDAAIIAQHNVDKAVVEGLTKMPAAYDAEMNAKKTMRSNQIRMEYKGMLVTPENSAGISTQGYRTYRILYGMPITTRNKIAHEIINNAENEQLIRQYRIFTRPLSIPGTESDTIKN